MQVKRRRLWNRVNQQIFVWAGEEAKEIKYSGFRFKIPPRTETAKKGKHSIYKFESARDSKDRLIPGTVAVTDVMHSSPNGGVHRIFDVAACCEYIQRDKDALFDQGLAIVSDPNDVDEAMAEIQPLYEASQDKRAHQILQDEMERQRKMSEKGQIVTERENPQVVQWAMAHLARRGKTVKPAISTEAIAAVLEGRVNVEVPPRPEAEPVSDAPAPEAPSNPNGNKELYRECEEWGVRLSKRELESLVTGDEEQIGFITEKLRAKKEAAQAEA